MTLEEVAQALGVTKAQVSKMERGITRLNGQWLDELARLYRCSIHDLIDDDKPVRMLAQKEGGFYEFSTIPMVGRVDARQVGLVEYCDPQMQYSLRFSVPKAVQGLHRPQMFALTLELGGYDKHPRDSQLIFLRLNEENRHLLKHGSIVIVVQKDNRGKEGAHFLRAIDVDNQGLAYAVYKIKHGRNAATTFSSSLLAGNMGIYEIMAIQREEYPQSDQKMQAREIPLENNELNLLAVLVKSIRDE